jgi:hypothetical protein
MKEFDGLNTWERRGLLLFAVIVLLFGALVTYRSAYGHRRMGDVNMLFRAAWYSRLGGTELYTFQSDNNLNYHYPPTFAILLAPFAHPPAEVASSFTMPLGVSVTLWYFLNLTFLILAVHLLASTLESALSTPTLPYGRRWWLLRLVPVLVCLVDLGTTLNQGQVTIVLLLLITLSLRAMIQNQRFVSGLWLGLAISIKLFPAFLFLVPLWRRDFRAIGGIALSLVLGLIVLPSIVYGPKQTIDLYQQLQDVLIEPAFGWDEDFSRHDQLFSTSGPTSQSLMYAITNILQLYSIEQYTTPPTLARLLHWGLGGVLTLITLLTFHSTAHHTSSGGNAPRTVLFAGSLCLLMVALCPVSHKHYLMLSLPLVMALLVYHRLPSGYPGYPLNLLLPIYLATSILSSLPWLDVLKDQCLPLGGILLLWVGSIWTGSRIALGDELTSCPPQGLCSSI